jgi:metallo-beta-lactamase class B
MKRVYLVTVLICITTLFVSCTIKENVSKNTIVEEQILKSGSEDSNYVELNRVKDDIWVHTTYADYDAEVVIPGHGKFGSIELIKHTLDLLEQ